MTIRTAALITAVMLGALLATCPALAENQNNLKLIKALGGPLTSADFHDHGTPAAEKVELGKLLMFDKILSGNKNISCASCHHPFAGTGDGLSLPVGEGGGGFGVTRDTGGSDSAIHERVPRNAPPLFNLGAKEITVLFHDGRLTADPLHPSGFQSPAGDDLPTGLENIIAAQAMFPVTSATEMAGQAGENAVADAAAAGNLAGDDGVWELLAQRLRENAIYVELFQAAFPDIITAQDITFVHAANAISAFERVAWRADRSAFDRFLRGNTGALTNLAKRGMRLFYQGRGGGTSCASCHGGRLQTDHGFHAIAMPQLGPGKGDGVGGHEDFGREQVTGDSTDRYRFRTPTLRNVALTAPYGHAGAFDKLEDVVTHHLDTLESIYSYDSAQAVLPSRNDLDEIDFVVMRDRVIVDRIADRSDLYFLNYTDKDVGMILEFLHALTDPGSIDLRGDVPESVPSGLPVSD